MIICIVLSPPCGGFRGLLLFHLLNVVHFGVSKLAVHVDDNGNGYSGFTGSNGYYKQGKKQSLGLSGKKISIEVRAKMMIATTKSKNSIYTTNTATRNSRLS